MNDICYKLSADILLDPHLNNHNKNMVEINYLSLKKIF